MALASVSRHCDEAVGAGDQDGQGAQVAERVEVRHGVGGAPQVARARLREKPGMRSPQQYKIGICLFAIAHAANLHSTA